ncbi:S1 family peptidase [Streptomyces sp. NY05-11A]|uniref:S1 family peptidase n=1 Tax=Streptomyces soliscabiei TaxID=588897 RepID=UPI0029B6AAE3|nr:S1 family peptidase [Streptomyces sp. NY05-11A]MDX2682976.1 S1 family peptidase [Streptomyces sp. NY05-11A]
MRRTRLKHVCLAALLTLAGLAGTGTPPAAANGGEPTAATATTTPGSAAASASSTAPAAALLDAMRQDLGLTEEQAVARLDAERAATALEPKARRTAGAAYAGSWFDAAAGRLTVAVTSQATRSTLATLRAEGAGVRVVEHSARALDTAKSRIDRLSAPFGVGSWHVDPEANAVVVSVVGDRRSDNDVQRFLAQARTAGPVIVETVASAPRTFAAGTVGGDPYYTGNVRCSIGFSVYGGFVTAGHCGRAGAGVSGWDGSYVGAFQGSSFPGNDYAWVSVGSGWWTVPVVLGWGTVSDQLVRGSAEAPVGASVCRSGSTTHWHCGTVQAKNETVNYSEGAVHQMTKTNVCAEGGDSGGSFISGDQAQGVTSGGWGNCSSGGETWYQPVNEILNRYGLTLHTY